MSAESKITRNLVFSVIDESRQPGQHKVLIAIRPVPFYNPHIMFDVAGNIHMHTPYSDGAGYHDEIAEAAIAAGLDFVVITDHNVWVDGVEGYYENDDGRVLLLVGEEVHDVRRSPQVNHCLIIGAEAEMALYAADPQALIDETKRLGGFSFLAHPYDPAAPAVGEADYPWVDWDIERFTGLELWNYMSHCKGLMTSRIQALRVVLNPYKHVSAPNPLTLKKWDSLLTEGKHVSVIGGSDGHALTYRMGPIERVVFPYEEMFRAVNTHLSLDEPLSGEFATDKPRLLRAIGQGRSWVAYDLPFPSQGFRFTAQSYDRGTIGDTVRMEAGATLQVRAPTNADIRIIHNGEIVARAERDVSLIHIPVDPGAYRVECYLPFEGHFCGWIFSNPIYLVDM